MSNTSIKHDEYTSDDIQVLEGLEAVRKRPGMYIGTTSIAGLHHLVWEIIDNSVDEALAGYATHIEIEVDEDDVVTVKDDGRGMPVEIHKKTGVSTVETIFTVLHAGGKFGGGAYKVSGGLHGVGASVVNALSKWLEVTIYKDGKVYSIRFKDGGKVESPLKEIGTCDKNQTGSMVRFKPDAEIFKEGTVFDYETLYNRIRQMAFLNKGIKLSFTWKKPDEYQGITTFQYDGGIKEYVSFLDEGETKLFDEVLYCEGTDAPTNITVEIALQYNTNYSEKAYSFCNNIFTPDGGMHIDGFRQTLNRVVNTYGKEKKLFKSDDEKITIDSNESFDNEEFDEERLQVHEIRIADYKDLLEEIHESLNSFLSDLEKVKENPFITEEELQPTALIELSNKVLNLETQLAAFKKLQEEYDAMKAELFKAMNDFNIKKWTTNNGVQITRVDGSEDTTVMKFDEKRFAAENEELYDKYKFETVKKGRSGYVKITLPK